MSTRELVAELEALGVRLWEEDGQLRFRAPAGVLTEARRTRLRAQRDAVLDLLRAGRGPVAVAHPEQRHEPFPLTDVQSAYLLGRRDTFAYGGVGCHGYGELNFIDLDVARLQEAWNRIVARHDMLRAVVDASGFQRVLPEMPAYHIEVDDRDDDALDAAVAATRAAMDHRVYEPDRWPLFTLRVTRSKARAVLHFSIDFLICDFVSIQVLLDELYTRYHRPDEEPAPLEITFRDYLLAERPMHSGPRYERDRGYWLGRVDDLPPAPELPVTTGVAAASTAGPARFRRYATTLAPAEWAALREHAGRHGITPSGAVLAAYAEVIGAWSRQPRFTVDVTLLNRAPVHPQVGQLVGDFTSVDLLAVTPNPGASFQDRAKDLQATLWADLDHRLFSGVEVLRELTRRRGGAASLMPIVFTSAIGLSSDDAEGAARGFADLGYGISQTPQVWIDCQNIERQGGLATNWDVREGVFPAGLVDDMFAAYETLLRRLAAGGESWEQVGVVALPAAQRERRDRVNDTAAALPEGLLHDGVLAQAGRTPDAVALVAPDATLTYAELVGRARAVAAELRARDCGPAELVAVVADKGWQQIVAVLGALLAGAAYVPVDTNQPAARRDQILTNAGIRLVLTQQAHVSAGWPPACQVIAVDALTGPVPDTLPAPGVGPDDLAYVIHTSGSTGSPKGVMITHRAALNTVRDINERFGVTAADRILGLSNLGFDLSVYDIFGPPSVGAALVLPAAFRRGDPTHWADLVADHGVTVWNSVPAQLQMLADYLQAAPGVRLPSLRLAMLSGDWIPVPLPDQIRRRLPGLRLVSLGGATEAAIWSIWYPIEDVDPAWRSIPYGVPLANQTFHVLDAALRPRPDWTTGELYIGGAGLALGYLGDAERTAERFVTVPDTGQRLYRTGDLGRYLPDGTIEFLGREDFQVKIRGHRIELAEIETAILSYPGVGATAVVVDGDKPLDKRLVAFVEPAHGAPPVSPPARLTEVADAAAGALLDPVDMPAYLAHLRELDDVALDVMLDALRRAGLFAGTDDVHTADEIQTRAGVAPRHRRLVRRFLAALVDEGRLVRRTDGGYRLAAPVDPGALDAAWQRATDAATRVGDQGVGDQGDLLRYFRTSADLLPALLRGEEDGVRLLFPEGRLDVSDNLYADALFNRWANRCAGAVVRQLSAHRPDGGPLRVLEVGAGAGGTTAEVLAALDGLPVDYLYTDLSPFFVGEARSRFADRAELRYATFDLDADAWAQGLAPNSMDVIVAGDVLHATRDVAATLARLRELLVPGGWLVFVEMTRDHYQIMTSLELLVRLDGDLADFADLRQGTDQTFLRTGQWRDALASAGAELAACLPADGEPMAEVGIRVFAARFKPDRVPVDPRGLRDHLADRLPEYMVPAAIQVVDALPHTDNGKLDRSALGRWLGTAAAATPAGGEAPRTDLEERLAAIWADVLGVEQVGRDHNFFDLGGDSLQAAKLAGQMIDELPEAAEVFFDELLRQLLEQPSVGELAGYLSTQAGAAPSAEPVADPPTGAGLYPLGGDGPVRYVLLAGSPELADALCRLGTVVGVEGGDVTDAVAAVRGTAGDEPVHVVGHGSGGVPALELARQLAESGVEVSDLVIVEPEPFDGAAPSAYAADITLVLPPGTEPDPAWAGVCLGELRVRHPAGAGADGLVEALRPESPSSQPVPLGER